MGRGAALDRSPDQERAEQRAWGQAVHQVSIRDLRVAREVALPRPHRTGRAVLQHPVPPGKGLARIERARCRVEHAVFYPFAKRLLQLAFGDAVDGSVAQVPLPGLGLFAPLFRSAFASLGSSQLRASGRRCCPRWPLVTRCRPLRVLVVDWEEGLPCSLGIPACCVAKFFDPAWPLPPRHGRRSGFVPDGPDCSGPRIVRGRRWNDMNFRGSIARLRNSLPTLRAALSVSRDRVITLPVTTTQGSLPVARLHAFPPGIWTRLGLRRGVSALKSLQLPMSMCSLSQSLRFCPPCGSVSSSGLPRPQGG